MLAKILLPLLLFWQYSAADSIHLATDINLIMMQQYTLSGVLENFTIYHNFDYIADIGQALISENPPDLIYTDNITDTYFTLDPDMIYYASLTGNNAGHNLLAYDNSACTLPYTIALRFPAANQYNLTMHINGDVYFDQPMTRLQSSISYFTPQFQINVIDFTLTNKVSGNTTHHLIRFGYVGAIIFQEFGAYEYPTMYKFPMFLVDSIMNFATRRSYQTYIQVFEIDGMIIEIRDGATEITACRDLVLS